MSSVPSGSSHLKNSFSTLLYRIGGSSDCRQQNIQTPHFDYTSAPSSQRASGEWPKLKTFSLNRTASSPPTCCGAFRDECSPLPLADNLCCTPPLEETLRKRRLKLAVEKVFKSLEGFPAKEAHTNVNVNYEFELDWERWKAIAHSDASASDKDIMTFLLFNEKAQNLSYQLHGAEFRQFRQLLHLVLNVDYMSRSIPTFLRTLCRESVASESVLNTPRVLELKLSSFDSAATESHYYLSVPQSWNLSVSPSKAYLNFISTAIMQAIHLAPANSKRRSSIVDTIKEITATLLPQHQLLIGSMAEKTSINWLYQTRDFTKIGTLLELSSQRCHTRLLLE